MSRNIENMQLFQVRFIKDINPRDMTYTDGRKDRSERILL